MPSEAISLKGAAKNRSLLSHYMVKSGYSSPVDRLKHFPQGAPPSEALFKIVAMLFSDREAALVTQFPIKLPTPNLARAGKFSPVIIYGGSIQAKKKRLFTLYIANPRSSVPDVAPAPIPSPLLRPPHPAPHPQPDVDGREELELSEHEDEPDPGKGSIAGNCQPIVKRAEMLFHKAAAS